MDKRVPRKLSRRQRCEAALLLFAFLPTLTFLGHWEEIFAGSSVGPVQVPVTASAIYDLVAQQADQARHAMHCHTSLGSCSEQPMPAGVGLFATRETLVSPPSSQPAPLADGDPLPPSGPAAQPPTPPPRSA